MQIIILGLNYLEKHENNLQEPTETAFSNHKWKKKKDFFPLELWEAMFPLFLTVGWLFSIQLYMTLKFKEYIARVLLYCKMKYL